MKPKWTGPFCVGKVLSDSAHVRDAKDGAVVNGVSHIELELHMAPPN